jgi:photosystem II stability/assembly factor-like uncharacterized protein
MPGFGWLGLRPLLIAAGAAVAVVAGVAIYIAIQATNTSRNAADAVPPTTQATIPATATPPPFDYGTAVEAPTFQSVDMVSTDVGWAISNTPSGGSVLRTADGGGHWRNVSPPGVASASGATGYFLNPDDAWAAIWTQGQANSGQRGTETIWRTTDGGRTWQQSTPIEGNHSGQLYFVDRLNGWLLQSGDVGAGQDPVTIYRTTDGGATWTQSSVSGAGGNTLPVSCTKSGIVFMDSGTSPSNGWVTGDCAGGTPFFYATTDGGASWAPASLPSPDDPSQPLGPCPCSFQPPQFVDTTHGFLPAAIPNEQGGVGHYIYTTDDSGATWHMAGLTPIQNALPAFAFADPQHWFAATNGGNTLYGTSDGGKTWSVIANPPQFGDGVNSLQFTDAQHGWAVLAASGPQGEGSKLLQTSDGGKTWSTIAN